MKYLRWNVKDFVEVFFYPDCFILLLLFILLFFLCFFLYIGPQVWAGRDSEEDLFENILKK